MAGQNQYLTFAGSGGANTLTPAAWAALTTLLANGFQSGLASSQQVNTLFRQLTTVAAAVGKLVSDNNQDALDNGDYSGLALAIRNAVSANSGLQSLTVAPSSNTMVVTVQPSTLGFRSSSLGSGTIGNVTSTSPLTLTIPQGATLGMSNWQLGRVAVLAINVGGTMELAVKSVVPGTTLDEMGVISTTALSAFSTSSATFYSQVARSNVAYRVVGLFETTQATAGTYTTSPSLVQPTGGLVTPKPLGISGSTTVVLTSGSAIDITGIPPGAQRVTVHLDQVGTNGTSAKIIQLGAGTPVTTGYKSTGAYAGAGNNANGATATNGFYIQSVVAADRLSGAATLSALPGLVYSQTHAFGTGISGVCTGGGTVVANGPIDRIRLTTQGGTDTFVAGWLTVTWEF